MHWSALRPHAAPKVGSVPFDRMSQKSPLVRPATPRDVPLIFELICGLADYELRSVCRDLVDVALVGCRRLPELISAEDVAEAEAVLRGLLEQPRLTRAGGYAARERLPH